MTALKPSIDFSNLPTDHSIFKNIDYKKYASDRKAQFSFVKIDTAENVIHAFLGAKKKCYNLFLSKSVDVVFASNEDSMGMDRKTVMKGIPFKASTKLGTKELLSLINNDVKVNVSFKKLQSQGHKISMLHQEKLASNSFDSSAFYKDCDMCNVPFNCKIKNIKKCRSADCELNKLLVKIWCRISK